MEKFLPQKSKKEVVSTNRKRFASSLRKELMSQLDELSGETRVPRSRLIDEAVKDLLEKYEKRRTL